MNKTEKGGGKEEWMYVPTAGEEEENSDEFVYLYARGRVIVRMVGILVPPLKRISREFWAYCILGKEDLVLISCRRGDGESAPGNRKGEETVIISYNSLK